MATRLAVDPEQIKQIAADAGFEVIDEAVLPGNPGDILDVPLKLDSAVRDLVVEKWPQGLYSHQANAIEAVLDGKNVTLATPTASGKSLVFMACSAHFLRNLQGIKILALYPAKALIQDQLGKWRDFLESLGLTLGFIDGGVKMDERADILRQSHVVLMTPDVAHAWLLRRLELPEVRAFLRSLRVLILDEAHEYEGVFGTNMAYFLRRLQVASRSHTLICSTATIANPEGFIRELAGRDTLVFGSEADGSPRPDKTVLLAKSTRSKRFQNILALLRSLAETGSGRFLAFADSRKMVERVVAGVHRFDQNEQLDAEDVEDIAEELERAADEIVDVPTTSGQQRVLPYRAGYEEEDRKSIQRALELGELAGVVSTSALELGLDIGDIDLVVLLSQPPSMKSFWQRIGRAGRRLAGVCLFIDDRGVISDESDGLARYLDRPLEPSWLYLDNRIIQYTNALCAAFEVGHLGQASLTPLDSLPSTFGRMLDNELNPTEAVSPDLYALKQRGQDAPHLEFPLRSAAEQNFRIFDIRQNPLGTATYAQALREAYPGAIYYYMARPHRVLRLDHYRGEIVCKWAKAITTEPIAQAMVFPRFSGGILQLRKSDDAFVAEADMQVSERVQGFMEIRGNQRMEHRYGVGSEYSQRDLNRFFPTTGVCWTYPQMGFRPEVAQLLLDAFCADFGVQARDLGVGVFLSKTDSPLGPDQECRGLCIYDGAQGSLRLTERLASHLPEVVGSAIELARVNDDEASLEELLELQGYVSAFEVSHVTGGTGELTSESDWYPVVAIGERAMFVSSSGSEDVVVKDYRYTPQGLMYELESKGQLTRMVKWETVQPLHGETRMIRYNVMTGETQG